MSDLNSLNIETVRSFMLSRGGKVTNHELVKYFKAVLTNPETRDEARIKFKEIVNTLATITRDSEMEKVDSGVNISIAQSMGSTNSKTEDGGKQLTLRKKYRGDAPPPPGPRLELPTELNLQYTPVYHSPTATDYPDLSRRASQDSLFSAISFRTPLSPPGHTSPQDSLPGTPLSGVYHPLAGTPTGPAGGGRRESVASLVSPPEPQHDPPPVPPRRRSSDKIRQDMEEAENNKENKDETKESSKEDHNKENKENIAGEDSKISVKERSQKFDRMASEVALHKPVHQNKKRQEKADRDEEDGVTVFDSKSRTWIVRCAQGDYQTIFKLAADNPKLVKFKTALHWAAKHGNADLVKLIAGTHQADVNARTNGGYTPLHMAMQFGHEDIYSLLTEVYGADQNLRDWSGKKPRQYQTHKGTSVSADTFRKIKERKKHSEKDLGFLRIGSLNVRVKRTTEAFSNFLGVGNTEKIHKNWGSADNLPQGGDNKKMPPPKYAPIKKRKSKRGGDFAARSSVVSLESRSSCEVKPEAQQDSDSDAGFGSNWQSTV